MCWRDLLEAIRERGLDVTETQIRWAISSRKISRPPRDGSLRIVFNNGHVDELVAYFAGKTEDNPVSH